MPEISRFYGIIIRIFFESGRHRLPHIHAAYGEYVASYSIDPPALLAGAMPRKQQNLIVAWIELHQEELLENWRLVSQNQQPNRVEGLRLEKPMTTYELFNPQIYRVIDFEIVSDYTLRITFDDQTEQMIDFEPILSGPIFGPLKDKKLFDHVRLEQTFGTLEWPNGADISPTVLHDWPEHVSSIITRRQQEKAVGTA